VVPAAFAALIPMAVACFMIGLPVIQELVLGEVRRRGRTPDLLHACSVRDHVLRATLRSVRAGLLFAAGGFVLWIAIHRPSPGWAWGLGAEILLSFLVLQLGLSVLTLRFVLQAAASPRASRGALLAVRLAVLAAGWLYGLAVWFIVPGGPGEMLFAVLVLGVGLGMLGLTRLAGAPIEALSRFAAI
jgi:hypothetical protein